DLTNEESVKIINDYSPNFNKKDTKPGYLNDITYIESKTTLSLDHLNKSIFYDNFVLSLEANSYIASQLCNTMDRDESDQGELDQGELDQGELDKGELDEDESDNKSYLKLVVGLLFLSWDSFKVWLNHFALQKGFAYKIRTNERDDKGIVQRATYVCTKSITHDPNVTFDPTKHHNAKSQRTKCSWKLCVTYPKTITQVKINSFENSHNHTLTPMVSEIATQFRKLTPDMLSDIEKYVIQGRMDSGSIYSLLRYDYPNHPLNKHDLYNAVYNFRQQHNPGDSNASLMLQTLLKWKEENPL
ncbi:22637_t:CDS:1, partial [Cetraspora pellucida]